MESCVICCEDIKKPITCKLCDFVACYKCFTKYMLEGTIQPKCMKCEKPWSRKNMVDSFGQYFVTHAYKKKRENVLFEIEKAMLPDTQPLAIRQRKIKEIFTHIAIHESNIQKLQRDLNELEYSFDDSQFDEYLVSRKDLRMQIHDQRESITNLGYMKNRLSMLPQKNERHQNRIMFKCPKENCRGFVNTKNMKCEICETTLCRDCHEVVTENEHECNEDTVKTVKLMMSDSKNCPSCKAIIFKIDGCDQMFCTQCHTAFSWRTGEISLGRIHNPHYYEYLRKNGGDNRELGDIPCGGIPRITRQILQNTFLSRVHQRSTHVELYEIPRLNDQVNNVNGNIDLRIRYLNNEITIVTFKEEIYKREKALQKKRELLTILNTFVVVCADIFRNLGNEEHRIEFENIRKFTNESMMDVSRVYKCVVPIIDDTWQIKSEKF